VPDRVVDAFLKARSKIRVSFRPTEKNKLGYAQALAKHRVNPGWWGDSGVGWAGLEPATNALKRRKFTRKVTSVAILLYL